MCSWYGEIWWKNGEILSKYLKYVVDMVENGEKMVKFYFFSKKWWNGEMVKNGDLNFKIFFT